MEGKSAMGCLYRNVIFESSLTRQVEYGYPRREESLSQQKEEHKQRQSDKSAR